MKTTKTIKNLKITTTFDDNMNMVKAVMESFDRIVEISLGVISGKWYMCLDSKTQETNMGHNKNLRTYVNQDYNTAIKYWDKKLKQFSK